MSDLICRKSMMRCQTPGMCSPHGGCQASILIDSNVRYSSVSAAILGAENLNKALDTIDSLRSARDQLKAVNFDLNAGQQMMEQEIARLKAENEDGLAVIRTQKEQLDCYIKDAERLDRLDLECEGYGCNMHEGNRWLLDGPFNSARDAIDALADIPELKPDHDYDYDLGN